jgi:hypothetical protein
MMAALNFQYSPCNQKKRRLKKKEKSVLGSESRSIAAETIDGKSSEWSWG